MPLTTHKQFALDNHVTLTLDHLISRSMLLNLVLTAYAILLLSRVQTQCSPFTHYMFHCNACTWQINWLTYIHTHSSLSR